jgi:hypothetical protein
MTTFIVEFRLKPGSKNKILEEFEKRGPNRNPGIALRSAWVGKQADVIFAIVDSTNDDAVTRACESWSESGEYIINPVINIEQY